MASTVSLRGRAVLNMGQWPGRTALRRADFLLRAAFPRDLLRDKEQVFAEAPIGVNTPFP